MIKENVINNPNGVGVAKYLKVSMRCLNFIFPIDLIDPLLVVILNFWFEI